MNRAQKRTFGKERKVIHLQPNLLGTLNLVIRFGCILLANLPSLIQFRFLYKRRPKRTSPRVFLYSDNLDETNGISVNSRIVVSRLKEMGKDAYLIGSAYHTNPRGRVEHNGTILAPQLFSLEQFGYKDSEMAIPSLGDLIKVFRHLPPDLIEIETPASGASLITFAAKIVGIPVIQHYRTDMIAYMKKLDVGLAERIFTKLWIKVISKVTRPIIVPSEDFRIKVRKEFGIPEQDIVKIRRGVNIADFSPEFKQEPFWNQWSENSTATRFVYVGRVSKEKELDFLEEVWKEFRTTHTNCELLIVGDGPYLDDMKKHAEFFPEVFFSGKLLGKELSLAYAHADFFLFPSGTDTFGNVVVEALASGTPAIVSDSGGPKDIIESGEYGRVIPFKDHICWIDALEECHEIRQTMPERFAEMQHAAVGRSLYYDLDKSCSAFWEFYEKILLYRF
ncbi:MAG: glycosyltransferase [Fibrobacterales bacterium]